MAELGAGATAVTRAGRQGSSRAERNQRWLDTSRLNDGLASRSRRGAAATAIGQVWGLVTQLASAIVLARLLSPRDYGLVGMVLAVSALADQLIEGGLSQASVQRKVVSQSQASALFWMNVLLGTLLGALLAAASPVIAAFYGYHQLVGITLLIAPSYLISGALAQHQALLQRQLKFNSIAARNMVGRTASVGTAVLMAYLGAGYWALALMPLSNAAARAMLIWLACDWRPDRPARADELREMLRFGANVAGSGIFALVTRNGDNILIGRFNGAAALGLYSRAYTLLLVPLQQTSLPINMVAVPTLSRLHDDAARFRRYYRAAVFTVALLSLPLVTLMGLLADVFVQGLMGNEWKDVVSIFQVLAAAGFAQAISSTTDWLWISLNRAKELLRWTVWTRLLTLLAFVAGLPWGPIGVAWGVSLSALVTAAVLICAATRGSPVQVRDTVAAIGPALLACTPLVVATLAVRRLMTLPPVGELILAGGAGTAAYVVVVASVPSFRRQVGEIFKGSGAVSLQHVDAGVGGTLEETEDAATLAIRYTAGRSRRPLVLPQSSAIRGRARHRRR